MLRLLNGVKWFEWVLVGALVISGLAVYTGFQKYLEQRDAHTLVTEQLSHQQRVTEYQHRFYVLADLVVAGYVQAATKLREDQSAARASDIDAYMALAHPAPVDVAIDGIPPLPSLDDHVPALRYERPSGRHRPAVKPSKEPKHVPTRPTHTPTNERVETSPLVIAALTDMANRMRQRSCAAGATSVDCRP
jgi:hypothetical protein